jgi:hypothetical protein
MDGWGASTLQPMSEVLQGQERPRWLSETD